MICRVLSPISSPCSLSPNERAFLFRPGLLPFALGQVDEACQVVQRVHTVHS